MKLDRLSYLELVVRHVDSTLDEYPSRFCVLRIPLDKINSKDTQSVIFSLGQVRKLINIGFFKSPHLYVAVGHRPFDKQLIKDPFGFNDRFCACAFESKEYFSDFIDK